MKTIGKGNFAKVKLARHILTGREVNKNTAYFPYDVFISMWEKEEEGVYLGLFLSSLIYF